MNIIKKKITENDFNFFVSECKKWQKKLELGNWDIDYFLEKLDSAEGTIDRNYFSCRASITLATEIKLTNGDSAKKVIKEIAKHEMIHLLLSNFSAVGSSRFSTEDEFKKAEEELVVKLCKIIKEA